MGEIKDALKANKEYTFAGRAFGELVGMRNRVDAIR